MIRRFVTKYMQLIVANWKMYLSIKESVRLAERFKRSLPKPRARVVICPSFSALSLVSAKIKKSPYFLGAQDLGPTDRGAHTGEVSAKDLRELGCKYVIVGHSERRQMGESDKLVRQKFMTALRSGLKPILCVGETWPERKSGKAKRVVRRQLESALHGLRARGECIVAYEPIWAIGTGKAAKPAHAREMHTYIRQLVTENASRGIKIRVLYGGSVTSKNAASFLKEPEVDGLLVGGASTKSSFVRICSSSQ